MKYTTFMENTFSEFLHTYVLSYSGLAAMGIIAVFVAALVLCMRDNVDWTRLLPIMMISFIPLYLGSKLFGVLSLMMYRVQYGIPLSGTLLQNAGIVFYGGLLAYLLSCYLLIHKLMKQGYARAFDIVGATVPLFHGFARIGCFIAGCCYGIDSTSTVCIDYFNGQIPVQLIESLFNFLLFAALLIILRRVSRFFGHITGLYLLCYAVFRFIIEYFRADIIRGGLGPFSFSQYVSTCILIGVAVIYIKHAKKNKQEITT